MHDVPDRTNHSAGLPVSGGTPDIAPRGTPVDRLLWTAVLAAVGLAVTALVSSSSLAKPTNLAALVWVLVDSGPSAAAYLGACAGWGMLLAWLARKAGLAKSCDAPLLAVGLGVSFMLTLSHGLGAAGAFGGLLGIPGRAWAVGPVAIGLVLAALPVGRALSRGVDLTTLGAGLSWSGRMPIAAAWICGTAVLLVAACNPPGTLWSSEFGGYDVLSYHLQLPKEWLAAGKLWPADHNVYSYLPGYVEAAFLHLGAMGGSRDLLAADGRVLISSQLLCAGIALLAAWAAGRAGMAAAVAAEVPRNSARAGAAATAAAVVVIPWLDVVGSMAYNEGAMLLLLAAASGIALGGKGESNERDTDRGGVLRSVLVGWLVGVACGAKPTALLLGAPATGLMLLWNRPARSWALATAGACAGGLAAVLPWLIRNWMASRNPVFPQMAGVLGTGSWTVDQAARYASAHHFAGSWLERLSLMFFADASDPSGVTHRGLAHPQWAWYFPVVAATLALLAAARQTRRVGWLLGACLVVQIGAWLAFTHIQSRFLLPLIPTGSCAMGTLAGFVHQLRSGQRARAGDEAGMMERWAGVLLPAMLWALAPCGAYAVHRYLLEGGASGPNGLLAMGPGALSGSIGRQMFDELTSEDRRSFLEDAGPTVYCNFTARTGDVLYLLGDACPLYYTGAVVYNTTYDRWPLGEAIGAHPGSESAWVADLRSRGITRVLVSTSEITRLTRSGWIDPRVTLDAIGRSIGAEGKVERTWGDSLVLYRLR